MSVLLQVLGLLLVWMVPMLLLVAMGLMAWSVVREANEQRLSAADEYDDCEFRR
jgi:cytochrome c-type biogenesis protein CcmH/NrfF